MLASGKERSWVSRIAKKVLRSTPWIVTMVEMRNATSVSGLRESRLATRA